ncbi:NAD(P)/FAD-dependent oxidoreductase [Sphingomonas sp. MMS24-J13]|uniref:NAD(P)/FAD-dependent oxidoreductase n=1 Tax=Sphingomonas sp. MMS24-J13 TaxID=3238686 RepID=UPI00384E4FAC
MRRTDPLIVGGGPAGSAAAIALALGGASPLLIERHAEPRDTVCGGFLGWDALAALQRLGMDPWALGAQPIRSVRIIAGHRVIERPLPALAAGLSRHTLDRALLERTAALGVEIRRGVAVRRIEGDMLHLADSQTLIAEAIFLATGKHALRGSPREDVPRETRLGLRSTLPDCPDLAGWIELHLIDGGYVGLLRQEDGRINLSLSIAADRLSRAGGTPDALMTMLADEAPRLAERVGGAADWTAVAAVPYGWRARTTAPGLFRLGDQAAVIASVVGDGIAIALASGRAAAGAWLQGGAAAAPAFQRGFAARAHRPIAIAELARTAAERPRIAAAVLAILQIPGMVGAVARLTRIGP